MFDLEKQIETWRKEMLAAGIKRPEILNELENHLREEIQRQMSLTEAGAFQNAVAKLGEGKLLKQEFAKARQSQSFALRDNPLSLNLIGVWFVFAGVNALPMLWNSLLYNLGVMFQSNLWPGILSNLAWMAMAILLCSQMLIGIRLLQRRDFWRGMAVRWCQWALALFVLGAIFVNLPWPQGIADNMVPYGFMMSSMSIPYLCRHFLSPLPMVVIEILSLLNVSLLMWAYNLLTRPDVRNLFNPAARAGAN